MGGASLSYSASTERFGMPSQLAAYLRSTNAGRCNASLFKDLPHIVVGIRIIVARPPAVMSDLLLKL